MLRLGTARSTRNQGKLCLLEYCNEGKVHITVKCLETAEIMTRKRRHA